VADRDDRRGGPRRCGRRGRRARGRAGTREIDALDPRNLVDRIHAVCLSGGSAYGLAAADGVMAELERRQLGVPVGDDPAHVVPVVPTAIIFDLGRGGVFGNRPDASFGERASAPGDDDERSRRRSAPARAPWRRAARRGRHGVGGRATSATAPSPSRRWSSTTPSAMSSTPPPARRS
jgi:hypothetical protein